MAGRRIDAPGADTKHCRAWAFHTGPVINLCFPNRKAAPAEYTNTIPKHRPPSVRACVSGATSRAIADTSHLCDFRSIQSVSDPGSGLLASHLGIVAMRIANKPRVKERIG